MYDIEKSVEFCRAIRDAVGTKAVIDQENVEKFAQDQKIPFSDFASLCAAPEIIELISDIIDDVNRDFARVEQIKKFRLIDILLTAEDDELTATMKLKRGFVEEKHKTLIDEMYL